MELPEEPVAALRLSQQPGRGRVEGGEREGRLIHCQGDSGSRPVDDWLGRIHARGLGCQPPPEGKN